MNWPARLPGPLMHLELRECRPIFWGFFTSERVRGWIEQQQS
jgi:hypothetical protein